MDVTWRSERFELLDGEGLGLFRQMTLPEQKRAHAFGIEEAGDIFNEHETLIKRQAH